MSETGDGFPFPLMHSPQLLLENLHHLIDKNINRIEKCGWYKVRCPTSLIRTVFEICNQYKKNIFVKYTAVEILMRYLSIHYIQLKECCSPNEAMALLNENNRNDIYLRIFTSVRIADKLQSMNEHMTSLEMMKALQEHGVVTTIERIKVLERDMLKTINFDINFIIIPEYVEAFILSLHLIFNVPQADTEKLKKMAIELLDTIYPYIESLYQQMYECLLKEKHVLEKDKENYCRVKADYCNLAMGIVVATAHQLSTDIGTDVLGYLNTMTGNDERDMAFYAMNIIQLYYSIKEKTWQLSKKNSP